MTKEFGKFKVKILPALDDNYMYLIINKDTKEAVVVDPIVPFLVWGEINKEKANLTTILTTHRHW